LTHRYVTHPKNKTSRPGLDKYAAHPAVKEIYEDGDGIWAELEDGWVAEDGVITVHGCPDEHHKGAFKDFCEQFKLVERKK
jgi:hypothetical protein